MPHNYWKTLDNLRDTAIQPLPQTKALVRHFRSEERITILYAFEDIQIDTESYGMLYECVKRGPSVIATPQDGQTLLSQYLRFVLHLLEMVGTSVRHLKNYYNKFCKVVNPSLQSEWKPNTPTRAELLRHLAVVCYALGPLAYMAWGPSLFHWCVTVYWEKRIRDALHPYSAFSDEEVSTDEEEPTNEEESTNEEEPTHEEDPTNDEDQGDEDMEDEQSTKDPSDYPEALKSVDSRESDKWVAVAKEMVYWLRLVTAPFHYVIPVPSKAEALFGPAVAVVFSFPGLLSPVR